jgi:hypothetical protein
MQHPSPWTPDVIRTVQSYALEKLAEIHGTGKHLIHADRVRRPAYDSLADLSWMGQGSANEPPPVPVRQLANPPAVAEEHLADIPERMRALFDPGTVHRSLNDAFRGYSDDEMLGLIRNNARWLGTEPVIERILSRQKDIKSGNKGVGREARRFLTELAKAMNPTGVTNRPTWYDRGLLHREIQLALHRAELIRRRYLAHRADAPRASVLELGRALYREAGKPVPSKDEEIYRALGRLFAVVESPERERSTASLSVLTIEDDGWPRARMLTSLAAAFDLSYKTILRARKL